MMITKLRRSTRGLSPIFATLILIAIAVIAGIIVYMFTSGTLASMLGTGTTGQEKVAIQSASYDGTTSTLTLLAQSTGGPLPATDGLSFIVHDASGNTIDSGDLATTDTWDGGVLVELTGTATLGSGTYTATLVTPAGGSFVSPSFTVVV
jgi:archaeal type IV pilus assembly protein PilA